MHLSSPIYLFVFCRNINELMNHNYSAPSQPYMSSLNSYAEETIWSVISAWELRVIGLSFHPDPAVYHTWSFSFGIAPNPPELDENADIA